jgi:hypothetical protein
MIWADHQPRDRDRDALRGHLAQTLRACDPAPYAHLADLDALADSVALFCLDVEDARIMSDDFLSLALARASYTVGETDLAEAILRRDGQRQRSLREYAPLVRKPDVHAPMWRVCASRTLRYLRMMAHTGGPVWVVDMRRMQQADAALELVQLGLLRAIVKNMAEVWDDTRGHGALGLAGFSGHREKDGAGEWLAFCRSALAREQETRQWERRPRVFSLDLPVPRQKRPRGR